MDIKKMTQDNIMPTYARFDLTVESGHGATLFDADGKKYIDFTSGIGVNSLGCANEKWAAAVSEQAAKLQHISNLYYTAPAARLASMLCERSGFSKVFFGNSGAEANECAVKLARKYSSDKYSTSKRGTVLSLVNSFHGRTLATLTATGQEGYHKFFDPFPGGFGYVPAGDIDALEEAMTDDVCALFIEIIQGEGGVLPLDKDFVVRARELCTERDVLLVVDEVQTGIGRTGKLFAWENYGTRPDIVTAAKGLGGGLPIGACLCSEALGGVLSAGTHGSTFGGNPVVCAGACAVLETLDSEMLAQVAEKGKYITEKLKGLKGIVGVRGIGMMLGADIEGLTAKEVAGACVENGLLILTAKTAIRLLPPLTITYEEIDKGLEILAKVLEG